MQIDVVPAELGSRRCAGEQERRANDCTSPKGKTPCASTRALREFCVTPTYST
jgi:hypothetical protein